MSQIPVQNGQLAVGFCPSDYQSLLNAFSAVQFVNITTISSIVVSSTPPADHTVAWFQLDSFGRPVRLYFFAQGAWLSLHPQVPGQIILWNQVLPNFTTFDGGDANAISPLSGPTWQLANTLLDGSGVQVLGGTYNAATGASGATSPIGVGTFKSGDAIALGTAAGEENHVLTEAEMPAHKHFVANSDTLTKTSPSVSSITSVAFSQSQAGADTSDYTLRGSATVPSLGLSSPDGGGNSHNNLSPCYGVYFLQRTSRLFYVIQP